MKYCKVTTLWIVSLLIFSACATAPKPPKEIKVDTTLPKVELTQNGVIVDMTTVAFEWSSVKDPRVEGIYIYRQNPTLKEVQFEEYAVIGNRFQTHFLDRDVKPDTMYQYKFRTFSKEHYGQESAIVTARTLPLIGSVSWIHSIAGMPKSAKIIWRPHASERVDSYIIERKTLQEDEWKRVGRVVGRLNAEYIDEGLKDNYLYLYRIRVVTFDGIESTPSQALRVLTKPLPNSVENIRATKDLAKKIKVEWERSTQSDFAFYHLYRSKNIDGSYELIAKLQKSNSFVDKVGEDGVSYFYRVSVVDVDGLESEYQKSSVHGMSRQKPPAPAIVDAKYTGSAVELVWSKADPNNASFIVEKAHKEGWFKSVRQSYEGIKGGHFIDKDILPNSRYTYILYSVDRDGVKSKPSIEVEVNTPESHQARGSSKSVDASKTRAVQKEVKISPPSPEPQEIIAPMENLDLSEL